MEVAVIEDFANQLLLLQSIDDQYDINIETLGIESSKEDVEKDKEKDKEKEEDKEKKEDQEKEDKEKDEEEDAQSFCFRDCDPSCWSEIKQEGEGR